MIRSIKSYFVRNKALLGPIFAIGLPVIIQNAIGQAQFLINRSFLGHQDPQFLAAIGNVMTPYNALVFCIISAVTGTTILVAHAYKAAAPEGNERHISATVGTSFTIFSLASLVILALWELADPLIIAALGATGEIARFSIDFIRIISLYILVMGPETVISATLQGSGNTKPIMISAMIKSVLTIALDLVLINGLGPIPALGLMGAGVAMLIANVVGGLYLILWFFTNGERRLRPNLDQMLRPRLSVAKRILGLGLPTGFESFLWFSGQLVLVRIINGIDHLAIGSYSLVVGIQGLVMMIPFGMAKAAQALAGHAYGIGEFAEVRRVGIFCLVLALLLSLPISATFLILPGQILSLFSNDAVIKSLSMPLMIMAPLFVSFQALNILMGHSIRAIGDTKWMLATQVFGTVFVLVLALVGRAWLGAGTIALYAIMISDEVIRGLVNLRRFMRFEKVKTPAV